MEDYRTSKRPFTFKMRDRKGGRSREMWDARRNHSSVPGRKQK
jgi:hypothetical protein